MSKRKMPDCKCQIFTIFGDLYVEVDGVRLEYPIEAAREFHAMFAEALEVAEEWHANAAIAKAKKRKGAK